MIKQQLFIGAALLVGVATGYLVKPESRPAETGAKEEVRAKKLISEPAKLPAAVRPAVETVVITNTVTITNVAENARQRGGWGNWRERMERMKKDDPARYAEMTNRFAQFAARREAQRQEKRDFFSSIDTSRMSESARATHEKLLAMNESLAEIEERLRDENLSDEERGELMRKMWESGREVAELNRSERQNLIGQMAESLGFQGDDAEEIKATVNEIIQATENWPGEGRRGGRGGRGGRGQPPGR